MSKKNYYSESKQESDSNFALNSVSDANSDSESDSNLVFINLGAFVFFILYLYSSK